MPKMQQTSAISASLERFCSLAFEAKNDGLYIRAVLPETREADVTLALVRARVLRGLSVEFVASRERMDSGVRVIEAATVSTQTRAASSPAWSSPRCSKTPVSPSPWTAGAGAWTTSSSSACGASLKYEAVYLHEISDGFAAQRLISSWFAFYDRARPHSALGGSTPAEAYEKGMLTQRPAQRHSSPASLPALPEQQDMVNRTLAA